MSQAVIDSSEILLQEETDTNAELTHALANTRVVSNEETYTVESIEKTTVKEIYSLYLTHENGSVDRVKKVEETSDLFSPAEGSEAEIDLENLTIGKFTSEHLQEYPTEELTRNLTPIEPILYTPDKGENQLIHFAEIQTQTVVSIQLLNESGERQTIYKTFSRENLADTFIEHVGSDVELVLDQDEVKLTNVPLTNNETDEGSKSGFYSYLNTPFFRTVTYALAVWVVPFTLYQLSTLYINVHPVLLGSISFILGSLMLVYGIQKHTADESVENSDSSKKSMKDLREPISLESPCELENSLSTVIPVSEVTINTKFTEEKLELTVENVDSSPIWSYKTTDNNVFKDSNIVDFYTELGFDKSELTNFTGFVSQQRFSDIPRLEADTGKVLYLYPEDPR
jgi:hypothetical protein